MSASDYLHYAAKLDEYEERAQSLFDGLKTGEDAAFWRAKWEHPRFRGRWVTDVREASLSLDVARTVVARGDGFVD